MIKRVIFTVTSDLYSDQRMQRIANSLHKADYEVLLVGRRKKNSIVLPNWAFDVRRITCWFEKGWLFYLEFNIRLFAFLFKSRSQIICSIDLDTILAARLLRVFKKFIWIYDAHEYFTESPEIDGRPFVKAIWKGVGRMSIPHVDGAYTVSETIRDILSHNYNVPFDLIRNLPNFRNIDDKSKPDNFILYQGVLNKGRGLEELILAIGQMRNQKLYIAGDGDIKNKLVQLVEQNNLIENVVFLGKLNPQELISWTKRARIGINILDGSNKNYRFSLANKYFDYMMSGTPSISMNFPEYQKINQEYEISCLIDSLEISLIVNAITKLTSDKNYYDTLVNNCIKASKIYNWEEEEKKLLTFYNKL